MIRIPSDATADELVALLGGDAIPTDAPPEDLHAALYQVCKIVADHEAMLAELAGSVVPASPAVPRNEDEADAERHVRPGHRP